MSDLKNKFISVKEYGSISDYKEETVNEEIIEINEFDEKEAFDMEKKGFFFMPNKITYSRKTAKIGDVLNNLSKNKRKKINKIIKDLDKLELVKEKTIKESSFKEWYKLYVSNLKSKKHGIIIIDENWWCKDLDKYEKVGIFFKKENKIIAGIVSRSFPKNEFFPKRMSISFSAIDNEFKNKGVNDYLNILMIDFANECGYDYIFRGKDTNLYGKHLSSGIPIFKTSLGYDIMPVKKEQNMLIKFNNLDDFNDVIFFVSYAKDSDRLIGNLILKTDFKDMKEHRKDFLLKLRVFKYENQELKFTTEA
tara:strand:+ start:64740 stop:65660 length:921 start_codon:yes stop_codon:yes gene_type:complete